MGRILVQIVFPILLPSLLYALWMAAERRRVALAGTGRKPLWAEAPWVWLLALGVLFAAALLLGFSVLGGGGSPEGTYIPPHTEDGRVIPGHVEPK